MTQRTKRILLVVVFIIVFVLIGYAIYFVFFKPFIAPSPAPTPVPTNQLPAVNGGPSLPPTGVVTPELPTPTPGQPTVPTLQAPANPIGFHALGGITSFTMLETHPVLAPKLSTNGHDVVYYDQQVGYFYKVTPDGQKTIYDDTAFKNLSNVTWSPDNRRAVLEYPDGSKIMYNFATKQAVTLPSQWKDFSFSPDGQQIAFKDMKVDQTNRYITVADANGTNAKKIEPLGDPSTDQDVHVTWSPNNQFVALYRQSTNISQGEVNFIGFNQENYRTVTVEGRDLHFQWSPSGRKMVYSVTNERADYKPELWITYTEPDLLGTGKNDLALNTWADKCTFSNENEVYCAVPRDLPRASGIAPQLAAGIPDDIYKVNLLTGEKTIVAQPIVPTTIESLMISTDGTTLYWTDQTTGGLNKMQL